MLGKKMKKEKTYLNLVQNVRMRVLHAVLSELKNIWNDIYVREGKFSGTDKIK